MGLKKPDESLIKENSEFSDEDIEQSYIEDEDDFEDESEEDESDDEHKFIENITIEDLHYDQIKFNTTVNDWDGSIKIEIPSILYYIFDENICPNCRKVHKYKEDYEYYNEAGKITSDSIYFESRLHKMHIDGQLPISKNVENLINSIDDYFENFEGYDCDKIQTIDYYAFTLGIFNELILFLKPELVYNIHIDFMVSYEILDKISNSEYFYEKGVLHIKKPVELFYKIIGLDYMHPAFNYSEDDLKEYAKLMYKNRKNPTNLENKDKIIDIIYNDLLLVKSHDPFTVKLKKDFLDNFEKLNFNIREYNLPILYGGPKSKEPLQYYEDIDSLPDTKCIQDNEKLEKEIVRRGLTEKQLYEKYLEYDKDSKDDIIYKNCFENYLFFYIDSHEIKILEVDHINDKFYMLYQKT